MAEKTTFNKVNNFLLRVMEQKKTEKAVIMNCTKSGKKLEDGSWDKSLNVRVILNGNTDWEHKNLTYDKDKKNCILVDGTFSHESWEKDGKSGFNFVIFADKVQTYIPEKKEEGAKGEEDWN